MYENGNPQFGAFFKNRIETRIINLNSFPLAIGHRQSEIFKKFQSLRAVANVLFQLFGRTLSITGFIDTGKIKVGKNHKAGWIASLGITHPIGQIFSFPVCGLACPSAAVPVRK